MHRNTLLSIWSPSCNFNKCGLEVRPTNAAKHSTRLVFPLPTGPSNNTADPAFTASARRRRLHSVDATGINVLTSFYSSQSNNDWRYMQNKCMSYTKHRTILTSTYIHIHRTKHRTYTCKSGNYHASQTVQLYMNWTRWFIIRTERDTEYVQLTDVKETKINIHVCWHKYKHERYNTYTCNYICTLAPVPCILERRTPQTEVTSGLRSEWIMHCFVCDKFPTELQSATDAATSADWESLILLSIESYLQKPYPQTHFSKPINKSHSQCYKLNVKISKYTIKTDWKINITNNTEQKYNKMVEQREITCRNTDNTKQSACSKFCDVS